MSHFDYYEITNLEDNQIDEHETLHGISPSQCDICCELGKNLEKDEENAFGCIESAKNMLDPNKKVKGGMRSMKTSIFLHEAERFAENSPKALLALWHLYIGARGYVAARRCHEKLLKIKPTLENSESLRQSLRIMDDFKDEIDDIIDDMDMAVSLEYSKVRRELSNIRKKIKNEENSSCLKQ